MESLTLFSEDLASFVSASPFPVAVFDEHGVYRYTNSAGASFNGFSLREHVGKSVREIVPDVAATLQAIIDEVLATGKTVMRTVEHGDQPAHIVTIFPFRSPTTGATRVGLVFLPMRYIEDSSTQSWRRRLGFESLVGDVAANLLAASSETFDAEIRKAIGSICETQLYPGAAVVRIRDANLNDTVVHSWNRGAGNDSSATPSWLTKDLIAFARDADTATIRVDKLPWELRAAREQIALEFVGVEEIAVFPFEFDGTRAGFVIFLVAVADEHVDIVSRRLKMFADLLASALLRYEKEIALASALSSTTRQKQVAIQERDYLREEIERDFDASSIVHASDAMRGVLELAQIVGDAPTAALICGESGVGKELIARTIHRASPRRDKPLVKVNCASIPRELFESEFFGHAKGSFTSAVRDRVGRFELANGGTLFLDEVGEIPLAEQAKLLRVLQEGEFERVGDDRTRRVDVRIIAATNKDLERAVREGTFRHDLFFRLSVVPILVPPLRDRPEDVMPLVDYFMSLHSNRIGRKVQSLSVTDREQLTAYAWPGNVRELSNVIERSVILARDGVLRILVPDTNRPIPTREAKESIAEGSHRNVSRAERRGAESLSDLRNMERSLIESALAASGGRVSGKDGAAARLGLNPSTLRHRMKKIGLT